MRVDLIVWWRPLRDTINLHMEHCASILYSGKTTDENDTDINATFSQRVP